MSDNVRAVVIGREEWGEYDCLLTFYTRERGKIEAVARGLRKSTSKLAAHLEPLTVAEVFLVYGRRRVIVAGSVVSAPYQCLAVNSESLIAAGAIAKLVDLMTPLEVSDERVFALIEAAFKLIATHALDSYQLAFLVRCTAWQLCILSGYRAELNHCVVCRRPLQANALAFDARHGGLVHHNCATASSVSVISAAAARGLSYMASAPLEHITRLKARASTFGQMMRSVEQLVEERFDLPATSAVWPVVGK